MQFGILCNVTNVIITSKKRMQLTPQNIYTLLAVGLKSCSAIELSLLGLLAKIKV